MGQGNSTGDLQMRITTNTNSNPYERGFQLFGLQEDEFKVNDINGSGGAFVNTVAVDLFGHLRKGRALIYGSAGTSSAIHSQYGGALIGDLYFSTS